MEQELHRINLKSEKRFNLRQFLRSRWVRICAALTLGVAVALSLPYIGHEKAADQFLSERMTAVRTLQQYLSETADIQSQLIDKTNRFATGSISAADYLLWARHVEERLMIMQTRVERTFDESTQLANLRQAASELIGASRSLIHTLSEVTSAKGQAGLVSNEDMRFVGEQMNAVSERHQQVLTSIWQLMQ